MKIKIFYFLTFCTLILTWRFYSNLNSSLPFYFQRDMDLTATLDTIGIQSQMIPDHINHPGFGMYLILKFTHLIAYSLGFAPILTFNDLFFSLEPILVMAETIDFFRIHSPFIVVGIIFFLVLSFKNLFKKNLFIQYLCLVVLITDHGLIQQVFQIRSELYSFLYFSLALCFLTFRKNLKTFNQGYQIWFTFFEGFFLGLMVLAKIQSIILFFIYPLIDSILNQSSKDEKNIQGKLLIIIQFIVLIFFISLLYFANLEQIPPGFATFIDSYQFNSFGYIMLGLLIFSILLVIFHRWSFNKFVKLFLSMSSINIIIIGFIFSFLAHFLLYIDSEIAFKYMIYDAKMLFFRSSNPFLDGWQLLYFAKFSNPSYLIHFSIFIFVTALFLYLRKIQIFILLLIEVFLQIHFLIADRNQIRDGIWLITIVNVFSLIYLFLIYSNIRGIFYSKTSPSLFFNFRMPVFGKLVGIVKFKLIKIFFLFPLICMIYFNLNKAKDYPGYIYFESSYQAGIQYMFKGMYGQIGYKYETFMNPIYGEDDNFLKRKLVFDVVNWVDLKSKMSLILGIKSVNLKCIGFTRKGSRIWYVMPVGYGIIESMSNGLENTIHVDPQCIESGIDFIHNQIEIASLNSSIFKKNESDRLSKIINHYAFDIYLMIYEKEIVDLKYWSQTKEFAIIDIAGKKYPFVAFKRKSHNGPIYALSARNFLMIKEKLDPPELQNH